MFGEQKTQEEKVEPNYPSLRLDVLVGLSHLTVFRHLLLKLHIDYPKVEVGDMNEV